MSQRPPVVAVFNSSADTVELIRAWFVQHLITTSPLAGLPAVFTTTNERHVREVAGPADVIELVGKPYDLDLLMERVRSVTGVHTGRPDG